MRILVIVYLLLGCASVVGAQQPYYVMLNSNKGLPSNEVFNVFEDRKGLIWLSTQDGLCRYDGFSFKLYKCPGQTSVAGSNIKQDRLGRIWYQNFDGYCYYVINDSLQPLQFQNQPVNYYPIGLSDRYLFVIQNKGIDIFDIESLTLVKTISLSSINIQHSENINNTFYFLEKNVLYEINDDLVLRKASLNIPQDMRIPLITTHQNKVAVVSRFNEYKKAFVYGHSGNANNRLKEPDVIYGAAQTGNYYWVYGNNGVCVYKDGIFSGRWFKGELITSVTRDYQGSYWLSTTKNGIIFIPNLNSSFISLSDEAPSKLLSTEKSHYLFTEKGLCYRYNTAFNTREQIAPKGKAPIYYAAVDEVNNLVFTSSSGMNIIDLKGKNKIQHMEFALKEVTKINNSYYALAISGQAILCRYSKPDHADPWDSLFRILPVVHAENMRPFSLGQRVKSIAYHAGSNSLYYGSNAGFFKQTPAANFRIDHLGKKIHPRQIVSNGRKLYVLNNKGELFDVISDNLFFPLNQLQNIRIRGISEIKMFGNLLCISGENRVLLVDADQPLKTICETPFLLRTNEINDISYSNGYIHVLTSTGVMSYATGNKTLKKKQPRFLIDGVTINGHKQITTKKQLPYYENNITINYAVLDYTEQHNNEISYSINDEEWVNLPSNTRSISFAALKPGNYSMKFKMNDTVIESAAITFEIEKPYWLRWWFTCLWVSVVASAALAYYKWQISLHVKQNSLLSQNYELEKELSKSVIKSIKSQMNPHFFYNALNTIQAYIFTNDKVNAGKYLNKFSKLTRSILEMSEKEFITLEEEIQALELYLTLEKMRFDDNLDYTITIDESIESESVKIPPMLIQPHVENAIKHGLLHKESDKRLSISFLHYTPGQLIVVVDDNGIGRKRAGELNSIKHTRHQSFSTKANTTRIELINKLRNTGAVLTVVDKHDGQQRPCGTTINLIIPYNT